MISKACTNGKQWMHSSSSQVQKLSEFFSGNFKGSSKTHANFPELQGSSKKHKICKTKLRGSKNGLSESCTILVTSMQESPGHNKTTGVSRTHKNLVVTTEMCENASCFFFFFKVMVTKQDSGSFQNLCQVSPAILHNPLQGVLYYYNNGYSVRKLCPYSIKKM